MIFYLEHGVVVFYMYSLILFFLLLGDMVSSFWTPVYPKGSYVIMKKKFQKKIFPDISKKKIPKFFFYQNGLFQTFFTLLLGRTFTLQFHRVILIILFNYKHALLLFSDGVRKKRRSGKIMVSKLLWSNLSRFQKFVFKILVIF